MSSLSQKLYDFFKPLVDSWNTYGNGVIEQIKTTAIQVGGLISSVWGSFENIITNGTVYTILENILAIIGNIAEAFSNAWSNDENGDAIIQNLADAFNNILDIINKIVQSSLFQWILDTGVGAIEKLSEAVKWVTDKLNEFISFLTGNSDKLDGWAILIGSIATAIGLVVAALVLYNVVAGIAAVVTAVLTSPITLVVLAIAALIAIIVLCIKYWDQIKEAVTNACNKIKEVAVNVWNGISTFLSNIFNKIKTNISNVLNAIKTVWSNIWNGIKTVVSNVWNGIWSTIKNVINKILGGIESFVNGTIKGINVLLKGIEGLANAVGSVLGFNKVTLQLNQISLPRLATGNVAYSETMAIFGEYSGAQTNPEITTPQNIMRDTFDEVLSNHEWSNNGSQQHLSIYYMGKEIFDDTIDYINEKTRRTGKCVIKVT
jgi:phage-related protein